jgi:hypothetical protein
MRASGQMQVFMCWVAKSGFGQLWIVLSPDALHKGDQVRILAHNAGQDRHAAVIQDLRVAIDQSV